MGTNFIHDYFISKGWLPGPCERQSWVVKLVKGLGDLHLNRTEKELKIEGFLKETPFKKGGQSPIVRKPV